MTKRRHGNANKTIKHRLSDGHSKCHANASIQMVRLLNIEHHDPYSSSNQSELSRTESSGKRSLLFLYRVFLTSGGRDLRTNVNLPQE